MASASHGLSCVVLSNFEIQQNFGRDSGACEVVLKTSDGVLDHETFSNLSVPCRVNTLCKLFIKV